MARVYEPSTAATVLGVVRAITDATGERDVDETEAADDEHERDAQRDEPTRPAEPCAHDERRADEPNAEREHHAEIHVDRAGGVEQPRTAGEHEERAPRERTQVRPRSGRRRRRRRAEGVGAGWVGIGCVAIGRWSVRSVCRCGRDGAVARAGGACARSRVRSHRTAAPRPMSTSGQNAPSAVERPPEASPDRQRARARPARSRAAADGRPTAVTPGRRRSDGQRDPPEQVGDHPEAAEERGDDEPQAHEHDVDPEVLGHPARHSTQQALVGAARQPARGRRGSGRGAGIRGSGGGRVQSEVRSGVRPWTDHPRPARRAPSGITPDRDPEAAPERPGSTRMPIT